MTLGSVLSLAVADSQGKTRDSAIVLSDNLTAEGKKRGKEAELKKWKSRKDKEKGRKFQKFKEDMDAPQEK